MLIFMLAAKGLNYGPCLTFLVQWKVRKMAKR